MTSHHNFFFCRNLMVNKVATFGMVNCVSVNGRANHGLDAAHSLDAARSVDAAHMSGDTGETLADVTPQSSVNALHRKGRHSIEDEDAGVTMCMHEMGAWAYSRHFMALLRMEEMQMVKQTTATTPHAHH
jgi:hypothetical protein